MTRIGTVINFCSLDHRFIRHCVAAVAPFSHQVVVPFADHLFDGTPEDRGKIETARRQCPDAEFVEFAYHHSITEMLRSRFWHNFARWVGFSKLSDRCDWVLFLDADEIVETDRFTLFLQKGGFETHAHLYFANHWYFREPRFRARQIEDSPAMVRRDIINVNRIFHENERTTFRRLPGGLRRVAGVDGRPMFHHYSWVMTETEMLRKVRTWGHRLDTDRDWETLVRTEFSREFSGKDFVHGYDFDTVAPLIPWDPEPGPAVSGRSEIQVVDRRAPEPVDPRTEAPVRKPQCIGFHSNQLGLRGTDVALYDYAYCNREVLGNESIIISDGSKNMQGLEKFKAAFEVLLYDDFSQVEGFVDRRGMDAVYFQKAGFDDGRRVSNARNLVHAVFQCYAPHGDVYAYISGWLARAMTGGRHPYVPYMARLPESDHHFRERLGIPADAVVFGRHGGRDQFDIDFARRVVREVARARPDLYFLFMNTDRFCDPEENIIHLNPTWDLTAKVGFINTCDAMLHARTQGETFGLAIAEFLLRDKPVIAWGDGVDKNHLEMLGDCGLFYQDPAALFNLLTGFEKTEAGGRYRQRVAAFTPERVMERFRDVFLWV
jgi:hypothetical protein